MGINPVYLTKEQYGQYDRSDSAAPTPADDNTQGYYVGFRWLVVEGDLYICADNTTGAAVWEIETDDMDRIMRAWIYIMWPVFNFLNIPLDPDNQYTSAGISITGNTLSDTESGLPVEDNEFFKLTGTRFSDGYYYAETATAATIQIYGTFPRDLVAGDRVTIDPIVIPSGVDAVLGRMTAYDVYERPKLQGAESESGAGYTLDPQNTTTIGGLRYPTSVSAGIQQFQRPKFL